MSLKRIPRVAMGQPLSATWANQIVDAINGLLSAGAGGFSQAFQGAGGQQVVSIPFAKLAICSLTEELEAGSSATAVFARWTGSAWEATTEVVPGEVWSVTDDDEGSVDTICIIWWEPSRGAWVILKVACI